MVECQQVSEDSDIESGVEPVLPARGSNIVIPAASLVRWSKRLSGAACLICLWAGSYPDAAARQSPVLPATDSSSLSRVLAMSASSDDGVSGCGVSIPADASHGHQLDAMMMYLFFGFLVCFMLDHSCLAIPFNLRVPISAVMFLCAGLLHLVFEASTLRSDDVPALFGRLKEGMSMVAYHIDPHSMMYLLLPPLLYESASAMSWHVLRKVLLSALLLAIPGVIVNTFVTGIILRSVIVLNGKAAFWRECWLLGSILSATDPVAVVAALSQLGAPQKLSHLVEGESLINDASSVVMCLLLMDWATRNDPDAKKRCPGVGVDGFPETGCLFGFAFAMTLGGVAVGLFFAVVATWWTNLSVPRHLPALEIAIVIIFVYLAFFVAESLQCSGVIATVVFGFYVSARTKQMLTHEGRHAHHIIMAQISYWCNQLVFFIAGVVCFRFMFPTDLNTQNCEHTGFKGRAWFELLMIYVIIHITRAAVIFAFKPVLARMGYGLNNKECIVMVWGGLRGAVGLIMGLMVEHKAGIPRGLDQMIGFHVSGIVFLTLVINGSTIDELYTKLNIYPQNDFRKQYLRKSLARLEGESQRSGLHTLCRHWLFTGCDFRQIVRCVPNFKHVRFNAAGAPYADRVEQVEKTLADLKAAAEHHHHSIAQKAPSTGRESSFEDSWTMQKQKSRQRFEGLIRDSSGIVDKKDQMVNVKNSGGHDIFWNPGRSVESGCYVSSRPLALLGELGSTNCMSFQVQIKRLEAAHVFVGLLAGNDEDESVDGCDELSGVRIVKASDLSSSLLGSVSNSIGLNCSSLDVVYSGPYGSGELPSKADDAPALQGETISISVRRPAGGKWEVVFEIYPAGKQLYRARRVCSFGPFSHTEVYPCIEIFSEFRDVNRKGTSETFRKACAVGKDSANGISSLYRRTSALIMGAALAPGRVEENVDIQREASYCSSESPSKDCSTSKQPAISSGALVEAKVNLSFEPQIATDSESIAEMMNVLFNTIMQDYQGRHEHGVLGDRALFWLQEAVEEAIDRCNGELGSTKRDVFKTRKTLELGGTTMSWKDVFKRIRECLYRFGFERKTTRGGRQVGSDVRDICSIFNILDESKLGLISIFEPLVVEYASLESMTSRASFWERCPHRLQPFRQLGYHNTKAKVEALWAFIEAHEKVLHESPGGCIERFPDLERCLTTIVHEAREDLRILEELRPRRCFYVKHLLAMRMLLQNRLNKVNKFTELGVISKSDGRELMQDLGNRIIYSDQYFPRINTAAPQDSAARKKRKRASNAWDDIDWGFIERSRTAARTEPAMFVRREGRSQTRKGTRTGGELRRHNKRYATTGMSSTAHGAQRTFVDESESPVRRRPRARTILAVGTGSASLDVSRRVSLPRQVTLVQGRPGELRDSLREAANAKVMISRDQQLQTPDSLPESEAHTELDSDAVLKSLQSGADLPERQTLPHALGL